jgi:hypothetical protein
LALLVLSLYIQFTVHVLCEKDDAIPASLRFPRQVHLREDDMPDFADKMPKLKRWNKQNGTLEHDPVNMEEWIVPVRSAKDNNDLNVG